MTDHILRPRFATAYIIRLRAYGLLLQPPTTAWLHHQVGWLFQCYTGTPAYGPLCAYMTSSIKPEVHNVSQSRQSRTEPRTWATCTENWRRSDVQFWRHDRGQTDRQTRSSQYFACLISSRQILENEPSLRQIVSESLAKRNR